VRPKHGHLSFERLDPLVFVEGHGRHLALSATHFLLKLVRAAPASFLSPAAASHFASAVLLAAVASATHFFVKRVLAAPASLFSEA
jgi:hypothetical protein